MASQVCYALRNERGRLQLIRVHDVSPIDEGQKVQVLFRLYQGGSGVPFKTIFGEKDREGCNIFRRDEAARAYATIHYPTAIEAANTIFEEHFGPPFPDSPMVR